MDNSEGWKQSGWFREVSAADFAHHFDDWVWDWLDVPALIRGADTVFENPMIDRDPVPTWCDGPVALLGDAAHAMYPTGSNGGSQAIVDARILGAAMIAHGATREALAAYDEKLCGPISQLILRNRGAGPFGLLNMVDERDPAGRARGVHGRLQGRRRLRDRDAQYGAADDCGGSSWSRGIGIRIAGVRRRP